ncbi:N-carbamoylputrescine amidase [Thiotrichales bacterium 19S3-7]|nr:N-carbamoylputrescine amidase [Thiotrichales bacterium 19S3-7]MCF6802732.1 N-carbamoylputrescine amidase [Thiotrichales bacterium 19S3-11]
MRIIRVAAIQFSMTDSYQANLEKAKEFVIEAAENKANLILLPELFQHQYFCKRQDPKYFRLAEEVSSSNTIDFFSTLAKSYQVVLPISFFEKDVNNFFNSLAMIDATGKLLGVYRKSHIPDGEGYQEKFYFSPGQSGFKVFDTLFGRIGCGICWDQWFPEAARSMVLAGAEILCYPTAIGSEPHLPEYDSKSHWQSAMLGHAACNMVPVIASNRYGIESDESVKTTFYGSSFISDHTGQILTKAERINDTILYHQFNLDEIAQARYSWGLFRDRRPELYNKLVTKE